MARARGGCLWVGRERRHEFHLHIQPYTHSIPGHYYMAPKESWRAWLGAAICSFSTSANHFDDDGTFCDGFHPNGSGLRAALPLSPFYTFFPWSNIELYRQVLDQDPVTFKKLWRSGSIGAHNRFSLQTYGSKPFQLYINTVFSMGWMLITFRSDRGFNNVECQKPDGSSSETLYKTQFEGQKTSNYSNRNSWSIFTTA